MLRSHEAPVPHEDVTELLPLSPPVFHVMVSLADGDRHGYAIIKEVAERTGGVERLGAGTLYAIIKRLLADGLIVEVSAGRSVAKSAQRRRYYRLTALGRRVAIAEAERLERAVAAARSSRLLARLRSA
jgi:DNA-binding PadR family transcriptional regulator